METALQKNDWQDQMKLVKSMVAKNATDEEFALMCHIAIKYGLDPLAKQIWVVKYGTLPASIFTGRDGFLSIAHRTNQFGGMDTKVERVSEPIDVERRKKDGTVIQVKRDWQYRATCTVRRKDAEFPFISEVYEEEYTTGENLWTTKPRTMIGKVAESQCLRKAFNISGLYSPEEMPDEPKDVTPEKPDTNTERLKKLPKDIVDGFAWLKSQPENKDSSQAVFRAGVIAVMDTNHDDPDLIRDYLRGKGWRGTMVSQGEEGLPGGNP